MLLFALISVLNLALGFAAAVMLGYGPRPWWIMFADAKSVGTVRIEKLEDELPPAPKAVAASVETDEVDDENDATDDDHSDLDDEADNEADNDNLDDEADDDDIDEADVKSSRLQEINAEKLAKQLEEEKRRTLAKDAKQPVKAKENGIKKPVPPIDPPQAEADEDDALGRTGIIDEDDLSSLVSGETLETDVDDEVDEVESLLRAAKSDVESYDADESLDEIESLLQAAGQLEADSEEEPPVEEIAEDEPAAVSETIESEPADRELTAAEIEAMFNS